MFKRIALAAAIGALVLTVVPFALAGKGGSGKPGGGGGGTSASWITASPNPASTNSRVSLTGCGYAFAPATVQISHPSGTQVFMVSMWSTGCLDGAYFTTQEAGTYTIKVYQTFGTKNQTTTSLVASTELTVT